VYGFDKTPVDIKSSSLLLAYSDGLKIDVVEVWSMAMYDGFFGASWAAMYDGFLLPTSRLRVVLRWAMMSWDPGETNWSCCALVVRPAALGFTKFITGSDASRAGHAPSMVPLGAHTYGPNSPGYRAAKAGAPNIFFVQVDTKKTPFFALGNKNAFFFHPR
jgi:hypothetical protein